MGSGWCPRCGSDLIAPSAFDSAWRCSRHGKTLPLIAYQRIDHSTIRHIREHADVPLWLPDPVPAGWSLAGLASVGDTRSRFRATVAALTGPAPLGGRGEWLLVAEEPGIGLGAGYAGWEADDADSSFARAAPAAKIMIRSHPVPLWPVAGVADNRCAYRGEADGVWFWLLAQPPDAGYVVFDDVSVSDHDGSGLALPSSSPRPQWLRPRLQE